MYLMAKQESEFAIGEKTLDLVTAGLIGAVGLFMIGGILGIGGVMGYELIQNANLPIMKEAAADAIRFGIPAAGGGLGIGTPIGIALLAREHMRSKREERRAKIISERRMRTN